MVREPVEVDGRGLTGTTEGEDSAVETETGAAEFEAVVFTAPEAFSSRTIASTMAFSLVSSINSLHSPSLRAASLKRRGGEAISIMIHWMASRRLARTLTF